MIVNVANCSWCHNNHDNVEFKKLPKPVTKKGIEYSHRGTCPDTKNNLVMYID